MEYILLGLTLFYSTSVLAEDSLSFQNYEGFIYPSERSGPWLEGPLSSQWINMTNRRDAYNLDNKEKDKEYAKDSTEWLDPYYQRPKNPKRYGEY